MRKEDALDALMDALMDAFIFCINNK